jgi:radical SAM superfamily enzyme YgiQ (UPF0313 family)
LCAERTGDVILGAKYADAARNLKNEHGIDVSVYFYTGYQYEKDKE